MMNISPIVNSVKCTVLYTLFWTVLSALRYDLLDSFTSIDYCSLYCPWGAIYGIVNLESNFKFRSNYLLLSQKLVYKLWSISTDVFTDTIG